MLPTPRKRQALSLKAADLSVSKPRGFEFESRRLVGIKAKRLLALIPTSLRLSNSKPVIFELYIDYQNSTEVFGSKQQFSVTSPRKSYKHEKSFAASSCLGHSSLYQGRS